MRLGRVLPFLLVLLFGAACTPPVEEEPAPKAPTPTAENTLGACARETKIGVTISSEDAASEGQRRGIELATELLNLRGSFNYQALFEDVGSDPEVARRAVQTFVEEESVSALLVGSPAVMELAGAPETEGVALLSLFNDDEGVTDAGENVFSVTLDQSVLDEAAASATKGSSKTEGAEVSAEIWSLDSADPANLNFIEQYQNEFEAQPDLFAAQGYLAVFLVAAAVEGDCSNDPVDVLQALQQERETASPMGRFSFTRNREASHPVVVTGLPE